MWLLSGGMTASGKNSGAWKETITVCGLGRIVITTWYWVILSRLYGQHSELGIQLRFPFRGFSVFTALTEKVSTYVEYPTKTIKS